jgi:hypothetical protein
MPEEKETYSMMSDEFDFAAPIKKNIPHGYPALFIPDTYSRKPFRADFQERRRAYLEFCSNNPARPVVKGFLYELARLETVAKPVNPGPLESALAYIDARIDCADFVLMGIIRMIFQFGETGRVPDHILVRARDTILGFKYWPDEPGTDSLCTWTENHQVLFAGCEYLAGMLYPDEFFTNSGHTGRHKMERARPRLMKWMNLRFRTGFNEWLSNVYYDENIAALLTLADFCDDPLLARGAHCILDLIFFDIALNSFRGTFGSTHGRNYERQKKSGCHESTTDTQKIAFGMGVFGEEDNMSGIHLALSRNYRLPRIIHDIAMESSRVEMENKQIVGIRIRDAHRWGLGFRELEDGMALLSFEAYTHPKTFGLFVQMLDSYDWWNNFFFRPFKRLRRYLKRLQTLRLLGLVAWLLRKDIARNMREEAHITTYRTPDYMLSAALDYKKGYGGDQQHIWQATLSEDAVCFTTHPGSMATRSPDYWTGSGFLPRVALYKSVLVAVYRISAVPGIYMRNTYDLTHAYFPRAKFDEVVERDGWVFARKGRGYIGLYSRNGYRWQTEGRDKEAELIADGRKNIWLCEMGREDTHGDFGEFVERVSTGKLHFRGLHVAYDSPYSGRVQFGWRGAFRVGGLMVPLRHRLRYDNPYARVAFDPDTIEIKNEVEWLQLKLTGFNRTFSTTA